MNRLRLAVPIFALAIRTIGSSLSMLRNGVRFPNGDKRAFRLSVRTPDFHSVKGGSIPP